VSRTVSRISAHSVAEIVLVGSMLDRMELPSGRKTHSWGTAMMAERRWVRFTVRMSRESIV
jgi:hypothetical protein